MPSFTTLTTQALLLSSIAVAAPVTDGSAPAGNIAQRQSQGWESSDGDGNTRIRVSDKKINWGTLKVGDVLGDLYKECSDVSCGSEGKELEHDIEIINKDRIKVDRTLRMHADGSFATRDGGKNYDMFKVARAALEEMIEERESHWTDMVSCNMYNICDSKAFKNHNPDGEPETEYWYPQEIHIRVDGDYDDNMATLDLSFEIKDGPEDDEFCSTLTDIGSAVSGAVGNVATNGGFVFGLASLFCD